MYRDPDEPMVYDLVTRLQLMAALRFGYDGEGKKDLIKNLIKSADISLKMLSTTGEFPFGGRSNQFIHNETFYAAACEFYASFFKEMGDVKKAGMFKRAARLAIECAWRWLLSDSAIHHIKNYYPTDSLCGCEKYAYFDKYMITAGSWAYIAYLMADDSIEEVEISSENKNYVCETSNYFHKVFCKFGAYFAEFDTEADPHYDGSGLGRFHKCGLPSALCLSVPFAKKTNYLIDIENVSGLSICGGIKRDDEYICICNNDIKYKLIKKEITDDFLRVKFDCGGLFKEIYTISDYGLKIEVCGEGDLILNLPVFEFDGKDYTDITVLPMSVEVLYKEGRCQYVTDRKIEDTTEIYANRNGHYRRFVVTGKNNIFINIILEHI